MKTKYEFDAVKATKEVIRWIRDYFSENGTPETKAVIGISGGKDSSIAAALCTEALGKERILGVLMPQGEQHDIEVSYRLCRSLDIPYVELNIREPVQDLYHEIEESGLTLNSIASFNTPARIRMTALYAVSGIVGGRVVNTCNLSEDWVGYSTKFGDAAGDFSPLSHLTVTEIKAIGKELGLDPAFVDKTPIDGLCGKTDEDNLGFTYETLDRYIREQVCEDPVVKQRIDTLHERNLHKLLPMPAFSYYGE